MPRILRMNLGDPGRFADLVATLANFSVASKDEVLQRLDVKARLQFVMEELDGQIKRVRQIETDGKPDKPATSPARPLPNVLQHFVRRSRCCRRSSAKSIRSSAKS